MAYNSLTPFVLSFLGFSRNVDFEVENRKGAYSVRWLSGATQPTEAEVDDAQADVTVVNGQTFSQWRAEHGGDSTLTFRREAKDRIDALITESAVLRALVFRLVEELNAHSATTNAILLAAENATSLASFQAAMNAIADLPTRTAVQVRNAIKSDIDAGQGGV